MGDRPILFSAPMVRALLDGRKTQTRRLLTPQPPQWCYADQAPGYSFLTPVGSIEFRGRYIDEAGVDRGPASKFIKLPFLKGDRLWVRETYFQEGDWIEDPTHHTESGVPKWCFRPDSDEITFVEPEVYRGGLRRASPAFAYYKRLGRFMPRRYSRLTLIVTDVRVQRLQEISEADAIAEGVESHAGSDGPIAEYEALWEAINGPDTWAANPWIVAVLFTVEQRNIAP